MLRACATRACLLARSDGVALSTVVMVAALIRLAFFFRAPPLYVGGDSQTYLLPALNGPLLIFEHYIMAETLTTCLVALALLATFAAPRNLSPGRLLLVGLLFGLAGAVHQ